MNFNRNATSFRPALHAAAFIGLGAVAFAHHIQVPLSYVQGAEIITEVDLHLGVQNRGVAAYVLSQEELEGTFNLQPGQSFTVRDGDGNQDRVVFRNWHFKDIHAATADEIVDAISSQLTVATAVEDNGYLVLKGQQGGRNANLRLRNQNGTPLNVLNVQPGNVTGRGNLDLELSIPEDADPNFDFAGDAYVIYASRTDGTSVLEGHTLPIQFDATTTAVATMTNNGFLPTFKGFLNGNDDARARFKSTAVTVLYGNNPPAKMYFAYVVRNESGVIEYVSNRFTVNLVP